MKLAASLIVRNELGRYLEPCVDHLLGFCDELRVLDDGSDDGTAEWLTDRRQLRRGVRARVREGDAWIDHEGRARQELLEWTLAGAPTHVLAVDADEFVDDGPLLRERVDAEPDVPAWSLCMAEVWDAPEHALRIREDGGWASHPVPILWRVPDQSRGLRIMDRALACGRVPTTMNGPRAIVSGISVLHFGWANETERAARHARYAAADGGRFHSSRHLESIMWPDGRVEFAECHWPPALDPWRPAIIERAALAFDEAAA